MEYTAGIIIFLVKKKNVKVLVFVGFFFVFAIEEKR